MAISFLFAAHLAIPEIDEYNTFKGDELWKLSMIYKNLRKIKPAKVAILKSISNDPEPPNSKIKAIKMAERVNILGNILIFEGQLCSSVQLLNRSIKYAHD